MPTSAAWTRARARSTGRVPPSYWIRLLREHGFDIEDLIELSPPEGATTTYDQFVPYKWARHWPAEEIWRARKR